MYKDWSLRVGYITIVTVNLASRTDAYSGMSLSVLSKMSSQLLPTLYPRAQLGLLMSCPRAFIYLTIFIMLIIILAVMRTRGTQTMQCTKEDMVCRSNVDSNKKPNSMCAGKEWNAREKLLRIEQFVMPDNEGCMTALAHTE